MKSLVMILSTVVLMAGGTSFVGCNKNTPNPKDQVSAALKSANIQDVDVDYDKDVRVVHLKGTVDSPIERARAEEVAERAVGTSGKILNEVTVKGVDAKTADDNDGRIKTQLKDKVDQDVDLKDRDISFDVNNGAVEIQGWVISVTEKNRVSDMVRAVPGVRDVANALEVRPEKATGATNSNRPPATGSRAPVRR